MYLTESLLVLGLRQGYTDMSVRSQTVVFISAISLFLWTLIQTGIWTKLEGVAITFGVVTCLA